MNKAIKEMAEQILTIEAISTMFRQLAGKRHPEQAQDYLIMVNILVRLTENEETKLLEVRYDELLETIPAANEEVAGQFATEAVVITRDVFAEVLQLHKDNKLILWQPGKGAVLVNGN